MTPLKPIDWHAGLEQLFSATVNQQTLEEAAELMVSVSTIDHSYHKECFLILTEAIKASESGNVSVIPLINTSGYQVSSVADSVELLKEFLKTYLQKFSQMNKANNAGLY